MTWSHRGVSIGEPAWLLRPLPHDFVKGSGAEVTLDDARMSCVDQGLGVYRCSYLITQVPIAASFFFGVST